MRAAEGSRERVEDFPAARLLKAAVRASPLILADSISPTCSRTPDALDEATEEPEAAALKTFSPEFSAAGAVRLKPTAARSQAAILNIRCRFPSGRRFAAASCA